jgi:2-hydroxy-3-keto-5-methylthiopentenyl-1-phosphate phosphatase
MKALFKKFDKDNSNFIEFEEFKNIMDSLRSHDELKTVFNKYVHKTTGLMGPVELKNFME